MFYFEPVSSPRRIRFKVLGTDKLSVSWKEPKGDFDSYKLIYNTESGKFNGLFLVFMAYCKTLTKW